MVDLARWAVSTAERRRLRFSFQNQQCQRADQNRRAAARKPDHRTSWKPGGPAKGARFLKNCFPCVNRLDAPGRFRPAASAWSAVSIDAACSGQPTICRLAQINRTARQIVHRTVGLAPWDLQVDPSKHQDRGDRDLQCPAPEACSDTFELVLRPAAKDKQFPASTFRSGGLRAKRSEPGATITPTCELPSEAERLSSMKRFMSLSKRFSVSGPSPTLRSGRFRRRGRGRYARGRCGASPCVSFIAAR